MRGQDLVSERLAALGVTLPLWLFAAIYGGAGAVVYWRLWLLVRARIAGRTR